jgi:hypothetical protein
VVTALGNVVVVVEVVVGRTGNAQPVTGTVMAAESVEGGHNTGTVDVVVVVAPETDNGVIVINAAAAIGRARTRRRILDTLLMLNARDWAL